jgi:hypothetical protein
MTNGKKFYLWEDCRGFLYLTDYISKNQLGEVFISGYGYMKVTLLHESDNKAEAFTWALIKAKGVKKQP